jgi:hypothetical protein
LNTRVLLSENTTELARAIDEGQEETDDSVVNVDTKLLINDKINRN